MKDRKIKRLNCIQKISSKIPEKGRIKLTKKHHHYHHPSKKEQKSTLEKKDQKPFAH